MSYIRTSTYVKLRRGEPKDHELSNTYAYHDGKHVCITNGWRRRLKLLEANVGKKRAKQLMAAELIDPAVYLTDAEMRYMCQSFLSSDPFFKKLGLKHPTPARSTMKPEHTVEVNKLFKQRKRKLSKKESTSLLYRTRRKILTTKMVALQNEAIILRKEIEKLDKAHR